MIDYDIANSFLEETFALAEMHFRSKSEPALAEEIKSAIARMFSSSTQAFREAIVGCALARLIDPMIDIHLPYVNQGEFAFNGRTLDETVVNPFLQEKSIPCSKGPYLSALRRNIRFENETAKGLRDKDAFSAMLEFIEIISLANEKDVHQCLVSLLIAFVRLRDRSNISLRKIARLSMDQYGVLIDGLLAIPSGGLMPVLLAVAMLRTIKEFYGLDWNIDWQGINVADSASGAGGDLTVTRGGEIVLVFEVTERQIQKDRFVSTFNTKISPNGLDDYIFLHAQAEPVPEAKSAAQKYFAQGHDINFVAIRDWIATAIVTIGPKGRAAFTSNSIFLLSEKGVPAALKQAWNDQISRIAS